MKLYKVLSLLFALAILLSACGKEAEKPMPYRLVEENGQKFIYLDDTEFIGMGNYHIQDIYFQSWENIIPKILNGDFTEEEMDHLRCWYQAYGPFPVPTLSEAPLVVCPDGYEKMEFVWVVTATAMSYQLYYGEAENTCEVYVCRQDYSKALIDNVMVVSVSPEYILSVEEDPQRNATVYRIKSTLSTSVSQYVIYSFEANENVFYVREIFNEGDPVPSNLEMVIEQADGQYVQVEMKNLQECPSKEWLSGFGLVSDN